MGLNVQYAKDQTDQPREFFVSHTSVLIIKSPIWRGNKHFAPSQMPGRTPNPLRWGTAYCSEPQKRNGLPIAKPSGRPANGDMRLRHLVNTHCGSEEAPQRTAIHVHWADSKISLPEQQLSRPYLVGPNSLTPTVVDEPSTQLWSLSLFL